MARQYPCSWCGRPTRDEDRRYVDRYVTWWICVDCYRTTRHTGYRPLYTTAQNSKPIPTEGNTGSQSEGL
jgi:ribosomal protein L37AE/L43A